MGAFFDTMQWFFFGNGWWSVLSSLSVLVVLSSVVWAAFGDPDDERWHTQDRNGNNREFVTNHDNFRWHAKRWETKRKLLLILWTAVIAVNCVYIFFVEKPHHDARKILETMQVPLTIEEFVNAARAGNLERMQLFIDSDRMDVDQIDQHGSTALIEAVSARQDKAVRLLQAYADSNARDKEQRTPLLVATSTGNPDMIKLLLADGRADANARDKEQRTPLLIATSAGNLDMIEILLADGRANVDLNGPDGSTALMIAGESGNLAILKYLLDHGAQPNKKEGRGLTALMIAAGRNQAEVVTELLNRGADPTERNRDGNTVCAVALEAKAAKALRILVEGGKCEATPQVKELLDPTPVAAVVPVAPPSPQEILDACANQAGLRDAKPLSKIMTFPDGVGYDALLIGTPDAAGRKAKTNEPVLCLFNRSTRAAATSAVPAAERESSSR